MTIPDERAAALHQPGVSGNDTLYGVDDLNGANHRAPGGIAKRMIQRDLNTTGLEERHLAWLANHRHSESFAVELNRTRRVLDAKLNHRDLHRRWLRLRQNHPSGQKSKQGNCHAFNMPEFSLILLPDLANFLRTSDGVSPYLDLKTQHVSTGFGESIFIEYFSSVETIRKLAGSTTNSRLAIIHDTRPAKTVLIESGPA